MVDVMISSPEISVHVTRCSIFENKEFPQICLLKVYEKHFVKKIQ